MASGHTSSPQSWNRYTYSYNNPPRFTDPTGMLAGDFYDEDGNRLGTDGINDGNVYIVPHDKQAKQIKATRKNHSYAVSHRAFKYSRFSKEVTDHGAGIAYFRRMSSQAVRMFYVGPKITPIRLCDGRGALGLRTDIEVNARYEAEAVSGDESVRTSDGGLTMNSAVDAAKPPVINRSDMFSTSWLPPGGSVIFSVMREHLTERVAIFISYNYEWEYGERIFRSNEPQHRVYFRASDLPEKVRTKN